MLERPLRILAIVLSVIIAAGFGLFALDEFNRASTMQTNELAGYEQPAPTAAGEKQRERRNSNAREYIDDANDVLLKPFAGVADNGTRWVQRIVPTMLGLFFYGFVLAYVARFTKGRGKASSLRIAPGRS
ncbi:MAG: hypothetical protein QOI73_1988 [Solirubrobacteraceae bacterium]|nr:hypothetical protein [Solirubrobacteraceae bacterium]